jgi:uncharacterized membrane protein YeaQ/YmgE (transglycosylase-associated protein family)
MGIIAWIAVGLTAGLLTNMRLPGKRPRGLIFICLTCFTGALGGAWVASHLGSAVNRLPGPCSGLNTQVRNVGATQNRGNA